MLNSLATEALAWRRADRPELDLEGGVPVGRVDGGLARVGKGVDARRAAPGVENAIGAMGTSSCADLPVWELPDSPAVA
jgi:hypothetical protein